MKLRILALAAMLFALTGQAMAQDADDAPQQPVPFEGGQLLIVEKEVDGMEQKAITFNGKELAGDYLVFFDRMVDVAGQKVALFSMSGGGNACGAATVIIWKPKDSDIRSTVVGEDCGAPSPSVSNDRIYFVPFPLPGDAPQPVQMWTSDRGLETAGLLQFAPQAGTGWSDLDLNAATDNVDIFRNEAVYNDARKLLGDKLETFVQGLLVSDNSTETKAAGISYTSGCVPHSCGTSDAFLGIDQKNHKIYAAQQDDGKINTWPPAAKWPNDLRDAMTKALTPEQ